jgi:hypothetical protein
VFTSKEIDRLDGNDLRNPQGHNGLADGREAGAVVESQGEIALDGREARDGLILSRGARLLVAIVEGLE